MKRSKYFIKMFILLIFVFSTLLSIFIGGFYKSRQNSIEYQSLSENISVFEENRNEMDNVFNIAMALGRLMMEYDSIKQYAITKADYYDIDFSKITDINEKLRMHQTDFSNVNLNMALIKPTDNIVITSGRTGSKEVLLEDFGVSLNEISAFFQKNTAEGYYYKILPQKTQSSVVCIAHKKVYNDQSSIYILTSFQKNGFNIMYEPESGLNLILSDNCKVDSIENYKEKLTRLEDGDIRKERIEDKKINILYGKSKSIHNLVYISHFEDKNDVTLYLMLIIAIILGFFLSFFISFFITKHIYKPINKIVGLFENDGQFDSGDEVAFVTNRATQMIETNHKLNKTLEEKNKSLKNKFMFDILNGFVWGCELENGLKEYGLENIKNNCICVLYEYVDHFENSDIFADADINGIKNDVFHFVNAEMLKQAEGTGFNLSIDRIVFVAKNEKNLKQIILNIISNVKKQFDVTIIAALGDEVETINGLKNSYSDLLTAIEHKFVLGDRDIITLKEIQSVRSIDYYYPLETEKLLIGYILLGKKTKAMLILNNIFERNIYNVNLSQKSLTEFKFAITATIKRLLQKINKTEDEVFQNGTIIYLELNMCNTKEALTKLISKIIETISDVAEMDTTANSDIVCDKILQYINDNLSKDISMNDISEKFELSASNISKQLKNKYNIGFKSYLNKQRVNRAKEIMDQDKNIKIKDLALMVGFNNVVSFIRIFKKIEGISPGQYIE